MENTLPQYAPAPNINVVTPPPYPQVQHFSLKQWKDVLEKARLEYMKKIGTKEPDYKTVAKTVVNRSPVDIMEKIAMFVLIVGFAFTSIKVFAAAVPFSAGVLNHMTHNGVIDPNISTVFTIVTGFLFVLLATPSLIYFKLLDHAPRTVAAKKQTEITNWGKEWYKLFTLDWLTPRLPWVITYISIFWLIALGFLGGGNPFEMFLPIVVEIGLASTVAGVLEKQEAYRTLVWDKRDPMVAKWHFRKDNFMEDKTFNSILPLEIRDALINLKNIKGLRQNAFLETADPEIIDEVVLQEYRRFTGNTAFADRVAKLDYMKEAKAEAVAQAKAELVPPNGDSAWTPQTLFKNLQMRNIRGEYNENMLQADYGSNHQARKAWRDGAKDMYLKSQSISLVPKKA